MKLSPPQIDTLKKLISYKGYPEIDLQYEILDHVACKVEVLLEEKPTMSLDDAFRKVHSEFGIFGFSDLAESYTKSIEKRYRRFFWEEFIAFFKSYRIIYPAAIGFILYWLSVNTRPFGYELTLPVWAVLFFFAGLIFIAASYYRVNKSLKNYVAYKSTNNFMLILNFFLQLNVNGLRFFENPGYVIDFTFKGVFMALGLLLIAISFLSIFLLPRVLDRSIAETKKLQAIYES
ncbi:hypothetical protein SAMN04489724_2951 [Algoriphagus locisalis]|uniref:Uncharacterized protein n=1 Tax=Algoriphagus locisalis TaxID=305507 RepID=A0A1I7C894_9BACT|nr:hypothetical protein [Algoriphagus locisalis]SFT95604.1 hypothetical protein SAMN04489724_2951 [Algoriphagus locisalis]